MKSLGKITLLFLIFVSSLYGGVSASISPSTAVMGDVVTYSLKVDGSDIQEPSLYQICGENIISSGSRTNIEMIGTNYKKTRTFVYQFIAKKSCTVDPVAIEIDGKMEKSNSVELTVVKQSANTSRDFILEYAVSKTDLYVGESLTLTLSLKQKQGVGVVDNKFIPSDFKGLWKKSESQPERTDENGYIVTRVKYLLTPQREGNITIAPAELRIASRLNAQGWGASFMPQVQWKSYFSNEITLDVKPLPNNATLIGDFRIDATADKTTIHPNEAVNLIVKVQGEGNLEDIESFKPHIAGVNVFDEKSEVKNDLLSQKLVFVSDRNFTIPSFKLTYFDTVSKQLKQIHTKPIEVTVVGGVAQPQQALTIKKSEESQEEQLKPAEAGEKNNPLLIVLALVVGIFIGVAFMLLKEKKFTKNETQKFSFKDEKLLLVKLLPYKDIDPQVKEIVDILEKNLYSNEKEKIEKSKLKEIMKKYGII